MCLMFWRPSASVVPGRVREALRPAPDSTSRAISRLRRRAGAAASALALLCAAGVAAASQSGAEFSTATLKGAWVLADDGRISGDYTYRVGRIVFDGAGGCSARLIRAGDDDISGRSTSCTYAVGGDALGDGWAEVKLTTDGHIQSYDLVLGDAGREMYHQIKATPGSHLMGSMVRQSPSTSGVTFSNADFQGAYAYSGRGHVGARGVDLHNPGVITADGAGNCTVVNKPDTFGLSSSQNRYEQCTYTVDAEGAGVFELRQASGNVVRVALVLFDGGRRFFGTTLQHLPTVQAGFQAVRR